MIKTEWSSVVLSAVVIAGIIAAGIYNQEHVVMILSGLLVGKEALRPSFKRIKKEE